MYMTGRVGAQWSRIELVGGEGKSGVKTKKCRTKILKKEAAASINNNNNNSNKNNSGRDPPPAPKRREP
jgi:hypothetical protein